MKKQKDLEKYQRKLADKQKAYDFSARMYMPEIARFSTMDPLCEQDPGRSPYLYCAGNPVNLVDPDGRKAGDWETFFFVIRYPFTAYHIGPVRHGKTNLSTNSVRFATRGEVLYGSNPKVQEERGSEAGAFRHALWQATITNIYGAKKAKSIGDAHETKIKSVNFSIKEYDSIEEADRTVDLMNNVIGRNIGDTGKYSDMKTLAWEVLDYFEKQGLFVAEKSEQGKWIIERKRLSADKASALRTIYEDLDKNGYYADESF